MRLRNVLLAMMLVPILIAGGFVITFLSYMFVPMLLAGAVGTIIYFFISEGSEYEYVDDP